MEPPKSEGSIGKPLPILPFLQVKFIPEECLSEPKTKKPLNCGKLDGISASEFYKQVISMPSTSKQSSGKAVLNKGNQKKKSHTKSESSSSTQSVSPLKIFQYAQEGHIHKVKACLSSNCDINVTDHFGWTSLMCAVCANQRKTVEFLLQSGSDKTIKNRQGLTALDIAKKQNASNEIQALLHPVPIKAKSTKQKKNINKVSEPEYCNSCQQTCFGSLDQHNRSIVHLLSSGFESSSVIPFHIPENNRGFQMMLRDGWDKKKGLGPSGTGQKFPVKTVLKRDRSCIGTGKQEKPRITHFGPNDVAAIQSKRAKELKPTVRTERTLKRREREKLDRKNRSKEIKFRREFHLDS